MGPLPARGLPKLAPLQQMSSSITPAHITQSSVHHSASRLHQTPWLRGSHAHASWVKSTQAIFSTATFPPPCHTHPFPPHPTPPPYPATRTPPKALLPPLPTTHPLSPFHRPPQAQSMQLLRPSLPLCTHTLQRPIWALALCKTRRQWLLQLSRLRQQLQHSLGITSLHATLGATGQPQGHPRPHLRTPASRGAQHIVQVEASPKKWCHRSRQHSSSSSSTPIISWQQEECGSCGSAGSIKRSEALLCWGWAHMVFKAKTMVKATWAALLQPRFLQLLLRLYLAAVATVELTAATLVSTTAATAAAEAAWGTAVRQQHMGCQVLMALWVLSMEVDC
mmetsp:Transcript_18068/g.50583  ORF Transcript_18068/g.50583 Transcript_18068/m.50583 type:complete len:336 (-) Transcript_18068:1875-2882(-)